MMTISSNIILYNDMAVISSNIILYNDMAVIRKMSVYPFVVKYKLLPTRLNLFLCMLFIIMLSLAHGVQYH